MKKSIFILFFTSMFLYATGQVDVTIGSGTATSREIPVMTIRAYTYTQQIYLSTEINRAGNITKIRFYMVGNIPLTNSNKWNIYLGHVGQSSFSSTTDWIPVPSLTQVFSGYVSSSPAEGWYEIVLSTPFAYNGTQNLVVAVDENQSGSSSNFGYYARVWTPSTPNRGIWTSSGTNPNPANPPTDTKLMSIVNQVQFEISIPDGGDNPTNLEANPINGNEIRLTWEENTARDMVMVAFNSTNEFGTPINGHEYEIGDEIDGGGTVVWFSSTESFTHKNLLDDTEYFYKVWSKASYGGFSSGVEVSSKTLCGNIIPAWNQVFDASNGYDFPDCWITAIGLLKDSVEFEVDPEDSANEWWNNSFAFVQYATKTPSLEIHGSPGNGYTRSWLMSPAIDLGDSKTMYLQFDKAYTTYLQNASCDPNGHDDKFAVVISTNRGESWKEENVLRMWDNNAETATYVLNEISHNRTTETIPLDEYANVIKIGFYGESTVSNADNDIFIDNVSVTPCPKPTVFSCSDTTATSVTLNWNYIGPQDCTFDVYYDYESHIILPDEITTPTLTGIEPNRVIEELATGTKYHFYLRAKNSYGDKSLWVGPLIVTTLETATTVPFDEGFESPGHGWTLKNEYTNKWYVGGVIKKSGEVSAYVSMHSLLHAYSSSTSYAYIYKDIKFPTSNKQFKLDFYWLCGGNYSDFMNVFLTPTDVEPNYNLNEFSPYRIGMTKYYSAETWRNEVIDLDAVTYSDKTFRLIFAWKNSNSSSSPPPIAIDDIKMYIDDSDIPTSLENNNKNLLITVKDRQLTLRNFMEINMISIYNTHGVCVFKKKSSELENDEISLQLVKGVYIISCASNKNSIKRKILIR